MHTQTCAEYWSRRGSLAHTDASGEDLPVQDGVRFYHFASMQTQRESGSGPDPRSARPSDESVKRDGLMRGLLAALDAWSTDGTVPRTAGCRVGRTGTGVDASEVPAQFPSIPGAVCPSISNRLFVEDHGPEFCDAWDRVG